METLRQYNFQKKGNGIISVREALIHSSNFFFHNVGYELYLKNGGNSSDEETRVAALDSISSLCV